jgi:peptidyl-prolyl cis-trans isomerase SurA
MTKIKLKRISKGFLIAALLFISTANAAYSQKVIDKIVAKIGDEYILLSDIQNQKLSLIQNGVEVTTEMDCEILEGLMYEKLLTNQAVIDSVEVGDEVVNQEMESRLRVIAEQIGSIERLEEFYGKSVAQIKSEFFDIIKKRMQAERMKETITEGIDITPKEVKAFYEKLPKDSIPYINSKITVAHIVRYPSLTATDKQNALETITEARERVVSGEVAFETEAVLTSDDPGSKLQGGDLGWQSRGTMVPEFEAELFKLEKKEISPIFETQYGYHFLQLMDRKGDNYSVRHILVSPKVDKKALFLTKKSMDSLYAAIVAGDLTFEEAAQQYSEDEKSNTNGGKIVNPYSGDYKWDLQNINDIDPQMSRIIDRLEVDEYAAPSLYDNYFDQKQGIRIVKLLGKTKPHLANLTEDYQLIQSAAMNEKKQKIIDDWVKEKIQNNYIWISEEYTKPCNYTYPWLPKGS